MRVRRSSTDYPRVQEELFAASPSVPAPLSAPLQQSLNELVHRLDLAASPTGITRIGVRPAGAAPLTAAGGTIGRLLQQARREIREYLAGERTFFCVPLDLGRVPAFERAALDVANRIPYGEVRSYRWIAEALGHPDAARAVGGAMAGNPVPILLPCHRVVRTDGGLGGYSFGLVRKEALLALERATVPYVGCLSSRVVCRKGCEEATRGGSADRVQFATTADACASGYRLCPVCKPPLADPDAVPGVRGR